MHVKATLKRMESIEFGSKGVYTRRMQGFVRLACLIK